MDKEKKRENMETQQMWASNKKNKDIRKNRSIGSKRGESITCENVFKIHA